MTMIQAKMTMRWVVGVGMGGGEEDRRRSCWCFLLPSQFENVLSTFCVSLSFLSRIDGWMEQTSYLANREAQ